MDVAPGLHPTQMFSYTRLDFVHGGSSPSPPCSQVIQSPRPHLAPAHKLFSGNLLPKLLPVLSTIFILNPRVCSMSLIVSLSLFANSPLGDCSMNRTFFTSSSLAYLLPLAELSKLLPFFPSSSMKFCSLCLASSHLILIALDPICNYLLELLPPVPTIH